MLGQLLRFTGCFLLLGGLDPPLVLLATLLVHSFSLSRSYKNGLK